MPSDPPNVAIEITGTTAHLTWDASADPDVADYAVFRRTPQTGAAFDPNVDTPVASGITDLFYDDAGLSFDMPYDWQVFGRVAAAFDPLTDIVDLHAMYDASDAGSLTLSGSDVLAWLDLGPNNLDFAAGSQNMQTGGSQNGLNTLLTPSYAGFMNCASFGLPFPFAMWMVLNVAALDNWKSVLNDNGSSGLITLRSNGENEFFPVTAGSFGSTTGPMIVYIAVDGSGNMAGIKNSTTLSFGSVATRDMDVDLRMGNFSESVDAKWCQFIFASSIPSDAVRDDCIAHLNEKWSIF